MKLVVIHTPQGVNAPLWVEKRALHADRVCSAVTLNAAIIKWIDAEGFCHALLGKIEEDICMEATFIEEALKS